jgi:hypothetical protein
MGLRLSFGVGPLRASVPLTSRRRRAQKAAEQACATWLAGHG